MTLISALCLTRLVQLGLIMALCAAFCLAPLIPSSVAASLSQDGVTTVYLVRHAEKDTTPPDDPPLTEAGKARAQELARVLSQSNIKVVISSQYARTRQTAEPLAKRLSVEIAALPLRMDMARPREISPASIKEIVDKIHTAAGGAVLVVGHSNTVPEVIKALGGDSVPVIDEKEFDDLFVVTVFARNKAKVARLKYGASR